MNQQQHRLMQVLQKISIFKGLELGHIQRLLRVGSSKTYGIGEHIYIIGEPSLDMLVLAGAAGGHQRFGRRVGADQTGDAHGRDGRLHRPAALG